jgi:inosine-uridine nucleoside N-ribohydrolase
MIDVLNFPEQITLLCLGPLTNVALAIRLDPHFIANLKQLVVRGGSTEGEQFTGSCIFCSRNNIKSYNEWSQDNSVQ